MSEPNREEIERIKATDPFLIWHRQKEAEIEERVRREVKQHFRAENWLIVGAVVPPLIFVALCVYLLCEVRP